ncbi:MAG: hypothetical protein H6739_21260 [Alphaproteobacteria bacterium]|nr:hypothetical protein [Alphaproteobacteria bacterium]
MGLRDEIRAADMAPPVARRFAEALREVASADGHIASSELVALESVIDGITSTEVEPAPFEALWPVRDLLVRAAIYIAVVDGGYGVEEARKISDMAHRLGLSAHMLAEVEDSVFRELKARAFRE